MPPPPLPPRLGEWFSSRTFFGSPDPAGVAAEARTGGLTVSVCLPALDEAATIGAICETISQELVDGCGLVDELVVVDSGSTDRTAAEAAAAGARVVHAGDLLPAAAAVSRAGKGEVLWKSLGAVSGDVVVWLDSDTRDFGSHFVTNLVAPLVRDDSILLCKGFYRRPVATADGLGAGGGRVTELGVRPLLGLLFPDLAGIVQPLSGEYAGRTSVLKSLPMFTGYAVEAGILVDLVERFGLDALAQADLGVRVHRNRDVLSLGLMSAEIMQALLLRAEEQGRLKLSEGIEELLVQWDQSGGATPVVSRITLEERPPVESVLRAMGSLP